MKETPKSQVPHLKSWAAAALSGILLAACFPRLHVPGLVWVACLPLLLVLARTTRLKHAFLLGYVCGAFFFAGTCRWFTIVMEFYGHLPPALAVFVLVLFVIVDSVFFGGFGFAVGLAARRSPGWALGASPFLWVAMELARTYLITGFPWNLLGYAVQAAGVRQMASVTGVYGLSFAAVATSALLAWVLIGPRRARAGAALAGWAALLLVAQWRLAPPPPVEGRNLAILIQPNVPLDDATMEKWVPWRDPSELQNLVQFSEEAIANSKFETRNSKLETRPSPIVNQQSKISNEQPAIENRQSTISNGQSPIVNRQSSIVNPPLLVWAENPAPFFFTRDPIFRDALQNMARATHSIVIANTIIPLDTEENSIANSAVTLDPEGRLISRYDKIHLVPFGEYVPWWALPGLVHKITSEVGNFVPGSSFSVVHSPMGGIGVFICYEAIIPQLARQLVKRGAGVLVNISNDAWYGDSAAAYQHLEMARLRAIENRRYLLRATNNGLTVVIDPYGRVVEDLPRYQRLALPAHFDFETRQTFYSARGDVFAWLAAALGTLMVAAGVGRQETGDRREKLGARS